MMMIKTLNDDKKLSSISRNNSFSNWSGTPDHTHRILILGGSGSGKTNVLLNLIKNQRSVIDKFIYTSKIHSNQRFNDLLMEEKM